MSQQRIDDGGPAFPQPGLYDNLREEQVLRASTGMSLRDWLAGQALAGVLASSDADLVTLFHKFEQREGIAEMAYDLAEAMLAVKARRS